MKEKGIEEHDDEKEEKKNRSDDDMRLREVYMNIMHFKFAP